MTIQWNEPKFGEFEEKLVSDVLKSGYVSEGPITTELEDRLAKIVGCKYVIMTTSCTAALYLAVQAVERVTPYSRRNYPYVYPSLTFVATKNAIELSNKSSWCCDVDKDRFLFNFQEIVDGSQDDRMCSPIIVNILGRGIGENVLKYYKSKDIFVVCDNAGCLGSNVPIGDIGCYSLQGNKIISCGQGGFCATNDETLAKEIRRIKDFGRRTKEDNSSIGFNFKFNDILAAVALGQLKYLEERKELLKFQYNHYKFELKDLGRFIEFKEGEIPLWIEFITPLRDKLFDYLKKEGITCRKPWEEIGNRVNAKFYCKNCIWLPNGPSLSTENLNIVIKKIKEFFKDKPKLTILPIQEEDNIRTHNHLIGGRSMSINDLIVSTPLGSPMSRIESELSSSTSQIEMQNAVRNVYDEVSTI
jgi:perosamine synthetase